MANYEVLVPELTVHRSVGELKDPTTGEVIGVQNGMGETYYYGETIPEEKISPDVLDALNNEDHPSHEAVSKRLKVAGEGEEKSNLAARLGLGISGEDYDSMDEDDIVTMMRVLPSAAQMRIKDYELSRDEPRARIVDYNIGFGESAIERQEGKVSGDLVEEGEDRDPEAKPSARLKTRVVPDEGLVEPGEGITGTGDPEIAYGTEKAEEGEPKGDIKGSGRKGRSGGRRARQPRPTGGTPKDAGGGSLASSNE